MDTTAKKELIIDFTRYKSELESRQVKGYNAATSCLIKILKDLEAGNTAEAHSLIEEHFESDKDELIQLLKINTP